MNGGAIFYGQRFGRMPIKFFLSSILKRKENYWISQNGLKIDESEGKKGKVYLYKDRPYYLKDFTRDGISIVEYLQKKRKTNSSIDSLIYLAKKLGIDFPKTKVLEINKMNKKSSSNNAKVIWEQSKPVKEHTYLKSKRIEHHKIREFNNELIIPLSDGKNICSLQFIKGNGEKRFLKGGRNTGCFYTIGDIQRGRVICIAEGFATGASIHEATKYPVVIAFNCGNLSSVSKYVKNNYPDKDVVICADDDFKSEKNSGISKANEAAIEINAQIAIPQFDKDRPKNATDFNDMANLYGMNKVKDVIEKANDPEWPKIKPLNKNIEEMPYPIDALPEKNSFCSERSNRFCSSTYTFGGIFCIGSNIISRTGLY